MKKLLYLLILMIIPYSTYAIGCEFEINFYQDSSTICSSPKTLNGTKGSIIYDGENTITIDNYEGKGFSFSTIDKDVNIIIKGNNTFINNDGEAIISSLNTNGNINIIGENNSKINASEIYELISFTTSIKGNVNIKNIEFNVEKTRTVFELLLDTEDIYATTIENCLFNLNTPGFIISTNLIMKECEVNLELDEEDINDEYFQDNYIFIQTSSLYESDLVTEENSFIKIDNSTFNIDINDSILVAGILTNEIGKVEITNSDFDIEDIYTFISIENSGKLLIKDSNMDINSNALYMGIYAFFGLDIVNSTIEIVSDATYAVIYSSGELNITNSSIKLDIGVVGRSSVYGYYINIDNSDLIINSNGFDTGEYNVGFVLSSYRININKSNIIINGECSENSKIVGLYSNYYSITINESYVDIDIKDGIAIIMKGGQESESVILSGTSKIQDDKKILQFKFIDRYEDWITVIGNERTDTELTELSPNINKVSDVPEDMGNLIIDCYSYTPYEESKEVKKSDNNLSIKLDGNHLLFESLEINNIEFIKDIDYKVTKGSTIITFTDNGMNKIKNLGKGTFEVNAKYTNDKEIKSNLVLGDIINPKTGDNLIIYILLSIISFITLITLSKRTRKI